MPRITMLTSKDQLPAERHAEFDAIVEVLHSVRGPFAVLMHTPGLAQKVMEAGAHIRLKSTLEMKERELIILAVAREKDATYEWAAHVNVGRKAGTRDEAIEAVRNNGDVSGLEPDERDIITFVRQLLRTNRVEQDVFDSLLKRHDERWMVELTATVGQYQYIAAINGVFEVKAAPDAADQLPMPAP